MRGRGLLIAAAVLQLVGATLGLVGALSNVMLASADRAPAGTLRAIAGVDVAIAAIMIPASIALLLRKRWAWWVSMVMMTLFGLALLALPAMGALSHGSGPRVGLGEGIIIFVLCSPIFLTIGLLVGGRHAVFAPATAAETAAEPTAATPRGE